MRSVPLPVLFLLLPCALGCSSASLRRFEFEADRMGTTFRLVLYSDDPERARNVADSAFARVAELNLIFSDYEPFSEVNRLCDLSQERAPAEARPLTDELFAVLDEAQRWRELSGGAFDVTVGSFTRLWRRSRRQIELPEPKRLLEARLAFGGDKLVLEPDDKSARLLARGMRVDLGGIAIGWTLDELIERLRASGIDRALIDAGGDIRVSGPPPGERGWKIAIADDVARADERRHVVLCEGAITTSGDAFRSLTIAGVRYSHIVDPATGLGLTRRVAATAIARRAVDADALATSCCVLPPNRAVGVASAIDAEARIVTRFDDGTIEVFETPGFASRLVD